MQCGQFKDTAMHPLLASDMDGLCSEKDSTKDVRKGDLAPTHRCEGQKKSNRFISDFAPSEVSTVIQRYKR